MESAQVLFGLQLVAQSKPEGTLSPSLPDQLQGI